MNQNEQLLKAVSALLGEMSKETPELVAIMDKAKAGEIDEVQAMTEMVNAMKTNPDLERKIMAAATQTLAPLRGQDAALPDPGTLPELLFRPPAGGLPRLNPLYEAALIERIQFDGDIPELRTGPLPPGTKAAVPVQTTARSTSALGMMLKKASEEVTAVVEAHQTGRAKMIEGIVTGDPMALEVIKKHGELIVQSEDTVDIETMNRGSKDTDLGVYRRQEVPKPVKVVAPTGTELAQMSPEEQRQEAWRFLSTTQGRRTAIDGIRQIVAERLGAKWKVTERAFDPKAPKADPHAFAEWKVNLSGAGSTQGAFSFIDTASRVLASTLDKELTAKNTPSGTALVLEVISIDTVDVRAVGWAARAILG